MCFVFRFVPNLSQENLCCLLACLLASAVFLLHSILYSTVFEANHLLNDVFFASINFFIWSFHIFKYSGVC